MGWRNAPWEWEEWAAKTNSIMVDMNLDGETKFFVEGMSAEELELTRQLVEKIKEIVESGKLDNLGSLGRSKSPLVPIYTPWKEWVKKNNTNSWHLDIPIDQCLKDAGLLPHSLCTEDRNSFPSNVADGTAKMLALELFGSDCQRLSCNPSFPNLVANGGQLFPWSTVFVNGIVTFVRDRYKSKFVRFTQRVAALKINIEKEFKGMCIF